MRKKSGSTGPMSGTIAFDLGEVARDAPGLLGDLLADLMQGFETGELTPLKRTVFGLDESAKAFRYMAQARHTGKVVLTGDGKGPGYGRMPPI